MAPKGRPKNMKDFADLKTSEKFLDAVASGNKKEVERLAGAFCLEDFWSEAVGISISHRQESVFKFLTKEENAQGYLSPEDLENSVRHLGSSLSDRAIIKPLLPLLVDQKKLLCSIFENAVSYGISPIVYELAPMFKNLKTDVPDCLFLAVDAQCLDIVKFLCPLMDPKRNGSEALQFASDLQNEDIFNCLYPLSDPKEALRLMLDPNHKKMVGFSDKSHLMLLSRVTEDERNDIKNHIKKETNKKPFSKKSKL